ncbi:MAG: hypothetical protein Q8901_00695, partial [Candidatus Phytoplasma stylosanthis]|nr:hypothetical protein [Candidatus Phytoplasma stylosanthis]
MLANVGEGKHKIEVKYTFYGLNGLKNCQYPDKVPKDLEKFVQNNPFSQWHSENDQFFVNIGNTRANVGFTKIPPTLHTDKNASLLTKEDIDSTGMTLLISHVDNKIYFRYNGPKYVLDMD